MSQPRIITGSAKNKRLQVPDSSRPITDRIKQSVFDLIIDHISGAEVLDLFAGSGSLGIEALSREANAATFVEDDERAALILKRNIIDTGFTDKAKVITKKVNQYLSTAEGQFDLIFCDPPFAIAHQFKLDSLANFLTPTGLIVFRRPTTANTPETAQLQALYSQVYGESTVIFFTHIASPS